MAVGVDAWFCHPLSVDGQGHESGGWGQERFCGSEAARIGHSRCGCPRNQMWGRPPQSLTVATPWLDQTSTGHWRDHRDGDPCGPVDPDPHLEST